MKRKNSQRIGEAIQDFFSQNPELRKRILETRIRRGWGDVLGHHILQYTQNIYVREDVLYVSITSAALRSELNFCRDRLVKSLNEYAGEQVLREIVIR